MRSSVLDAQHTIYEGIISMAILPAVDGELSIMDDHEPIYVALGKGYVRLLPVVQKTKGVSEETKPIFIRQGVARMKNNELVILVE